MYDVMDNIACITIGEVVVGKAFAIKVKFEVANAKAKGNSGDANDAKFSVGVSEAFATKMKTEVANAKAKKIPVMPRMVIPFWTRMIMLPMARLPVAMTMLMLNPMWIPTMWRPMVFSLPIPLMPMMVLMRRSCVRLRELMTTA